MAKVSKTAPILTVSVAAELAGMHAQTVRQYDRLGLVVAKRTRGGGRRYSLNDVDRLTEIQRLSQDEGINLAGISRIFELRDELEKIVRAKNAMEKQLMRLRLAYAEMEKHIQSQRERQERVFAVDSSGEVTASASLELLRRQLYAAREDERQRSSRNAAHQHGSSHAALVPQSSTGWLVALIEQHVRQEMNAYEPVTDDYIDLEELDTYMKTRD